MSAVQVDDAQPAHADCAAALYVEALIIRPAMTDDIAHALDDGLLRLPFPK
jgi:hypothetical protein